MSGLQDLYQTVILEEARERHGEGLAEPDRAVSADIGDSHQVNPTCGDAITVQVRLLPAEDGGAPRVRDVTWEGDGCSISMASASLLSELAEGWPADVALERITEFREVMRSRGREELDDERFGDAVALSGVSRYIMRVKCAMLAWVALEDALRKSLVAGGAAEETSAGFLHC